MRSYLGRVLTISTFAVILSVLHSNAFGQPERDYTEDFRTDPAERGWERFGDPTLFQWDPAAQNLRVTWDSSKSNSYFALPLGTILNRSDSFSAELDLVLFDYAPASTPGKPGGMQVAFGFQNQRDARTAAFNRGTGTDSPNLVEFNFFPDTGFGATVWPGVTSTNSNLNYNGPQDFGYFELPTNVLMRIFIEYNASNETASLGIKTNGVLLAPVTSARLSTNSSAFSQPFSDFLVDTFAVASYTDIGVEGEFAGSLLAHGVIDNLEIRVPAPAVQQLTVRPLQAAMEVGFLGFSGWSYEVQGSEDLQQWTSLGAPQIGTGERIALIDSSAGHHRFYRVFARKTAPVRN